MTTDSKDLRIWKVIDTDEYEVLDFERDEPSTLMIGTLADCQSQYPMASLDEIQLRDDS